MQIYERLMDIGLTCPVCGAPVLLSHGRDWDYTLPVCGDCTTGPYCGSPAEALAAWLVLTGGPIPGEILPPMEAPDFSEYVLGRGAYELGEYGVVWLYNGEWTNTTGACVDAPKFWYFIHRDQAKIHAWLEEVRCKDTND